MYKIINASIAEIINPIFACFLTLLSFEKNRYPKGMNHNPSIVDIHIIILCLFITFLFSLLN